MKPGALQVEIRPRTAGQTVALAARMLQEKPLPILAAWLAFAAPVFASAFALLTLTELHAFWIGLLVVFWAPLFSLPLYAAVGMLVFSPAVTLREIIATVMSRTVPFTAAIIVNRLITALGLLALIVPGLLLWRNSWFLGPIVLLERAPLRASMRRGRRFATGFHGRVFGHAANVGAIQLYMTLAFASVIHFIIARLGTTIAAVGRLAVFERYYATLVFAGFALALPLATMIWFFVYLDVRIRKEGWDLEIAFRSRAEQLERGRG